MRELTAAIGQAYTPTGLQTLLGQRKPWNEVAGRPSRYPYEWVIPGKIAPMQGSAELARRHFSEETSIPKEAVRPLSTAPLLVRERLFEDVRITVYRLLVEPDAMHEARPGEEFLKLWWEHPETQLDYVLSQGFRDELERMWRQTGLTNPSYDIYEPNVRHRPDVTHEALARVANTSIPRLR